MEPLHRTLYEADSNFTITAYNCTTTACSVYCLTCDDDYPSPPSPSPAVADPISDHPNHAIPYLVSAACVLGVAFLLLTTCTILLRHRCSSRRRTSVRVASTPRDPDEDLSPVDHPVWHIVTVGLPQSVIDSITTVSYKTSDRLIGDSDCSVCLTAFEDGDGLRILPKCSHAFHLPCIDTWLRSHKNCPLCRAPVVNGDDSPPFALNPSSTPGSGSARIQSSESPDVDDDDGHDHDMESAGRSGERDLSDLGEDLDEDFQPMRRSISLDSKSVVIDVGLQNGEGSSEKEKMVEEADREGHGDSGISRMMKRSLSSSAKILSPFRGSKSQSSSSTLPL